MYHHIYINNKTTYLILHQRQLGGDDTKKRFSNLFKNKYQNISNLFENKNISKEQRQELWNKIVEKRKEEISKLEKTNSYFTQGQLNDNKISHSFYTHDNGGRPFKITIENGEIIISKNIDDESDIKLIELKNYMGIWIGYDTTEYEFHGNSALIKLNHDELMFVGDTIYKFKPAEEITEYVSYVGNNDVPYPIAYSKNFIYRMLEHQYINKKYINIVPNIKHAEDIVIKFYSITDHIKNFKNLIIIKERDIGNTFLGLWHDAVSKVKVKQ